MKKMIAPPPVADINVTPMVDVMLVLLIIFMVITPMLTKGQSVDLVPTKNPITMQAADKEDAVLIAVTKNGGVFLSPGNLKITADELPGKVKDLMTNKPDKTVFIKSDMRARYGAVEDVIDNVRAAGVDQIGLITELLPQSTPISSATPPAK
jgi:biopolymer transport protein ExbD